MSRRQPSKTSVCGASGAGVESEPLARRITARNSGDEFPWVKGLRYVVIGAELQTDNPVGIAIAASDNDNGDRRLSAQAATDTQPVLPWQADIENDAIDFAAGHDPIQVTSAAGGGDLESMIGHAFRHHPADLGIVLDNGHAGD
jgi:hypothetical protein